MATTITGIVKHRVATAAEYTSDNPLLLEGELAFESDTGKTKIGDGITVWDSLDYTKIEALGISDITGLQDSLDDKLESPIAISDVTDLQTQLNAAGAADNTVYLSGYTSMKTALADLPSGGTLIVDTDFSLTDDMATGPVVLTSNTRIIGQGEREIVANFESGFMITATGVNDIVIQNIKFRYDGRSGTNGGGISFNTVTGLELTNVHIDQAFEAGIEIAGSTFVRLNNCRVDSALQSGFDISTSDQVSINNCEARGCTNAGFDLSANVDNSTLTACYSFSNAMGFRINSSDNCVLTSCKAEDNTYNDSTYSGQSFFLYGTNITLIGCLSDNSAGHAIEDWGLKTTLVGCRTVSTGGVGTYYSYQDQNANGNNWISCQFDEFVYTQGTSQSGYATNFRRDSNTPIVTKAQVQDLESTLGSMPTDTIAASWFTQFGQDILSELHSGSGIVLTNPVDGSNIEEPQGLEG